MDNTKQLHFEKTIKSFSYNIIGILLPIILSCIPIFILQKYDTMWTFLDQGQFLLVGTGLYTSSIYLFGENKDSIRKTKDKILSFVALWLLIICAAFYATIYCIDLLKESLYIIDKWLIRGASIILLAISLWSFYRSIFIDFLKTYPEVDVKEESKKEVDNILNQL